jgi:hypothetical protein
MRVEHLPPTSHAFLKDMAASILRGCVKIHGLLRHLQALNACFAKHEAYDQH